MPVDIELEVVAARAAFGVFFHALDRTSPEWNSARPAVAIPEAIAPLSLGDAVAAFDTRTASPSFRLAAARLAQAVVRSGDSELADHFGSLLQWSDLGRREGLELLARATSPEHAFSMIEMALRSAGGGCSLEIDPPNFSYDRGFSIAFAEAGVTVNRPIGDFPNASDPRSWEIMAPQIFAASREVTRAPIDPTKGPEFAAIPSSPTFVLFEQAQWPGISSYQNLLAIDYEAVPPMTLKYRLFQSITTQMPVFEGHGGLSVDSGVARISAVDPGTTRIVASKRLRHVFPNHDPVAYVVNWMAVPFLQYLMTWFVTVGACP